MSAELSVVIPVYNEEEAIVEVIEEWLQALSAQTSNFLIHVMNDGSCDGTKKRLKQLEGQPHLLITHHSNRGHGQTCVEGYRAACRRGSRWVLQIDSDGQCDPRFFPGLWSLRKAQVVYGVRTKRMDGPLRLLTSKVLKYTIAVRSRAICADANSPYRLMQTLGLEDQINLIPRDFDLANVALAVLLHRANWVHATLPITFRKRSGGRSSVAGFGFGKKAARLWQQLPHLRQADRVLTSLSKNLAPES